MPFDLGRNIVAALVIGAPTPGITAEDVTFEVITGTGPLSVRAVSTDCDSIAGTQLLDANYAFRWTRAGGIQTLIVDGEPFEATVFGMSGDGSVVVGRYQLQAFAWTSPENLQLLGYLDPALGRSDAHAASFDGSVVVGKSRVQDSFGADEGFKWSKEEGMTGLGSLPAGPPLSQAADISDDGEVVVGRATNADSTVAARWTSTSGWSPLGDLPGALGFSFTRSVSANGVFAVGSSHTLKSSREAFIWSEDGGVQSLGSLFPDEPSVQDFPSGVTDDGRQVVGVYEPNFGFEHRRAFIWDDIHGMRDLKVLLEEQYGVDLTGWVLDTALAISPDGTVIVGEGFDPEGRKVAWIVTLPSCPWDLNFDRDVDVADLLYLIAEFGPCEAGCPADFDKDGLVGVSDLLQVISQFGACPSATSCTGDFNNDTVVDVHDVLILFAHLGPCADCAWDLNSDGLVSGTDVQLLIARLGPCE